MKAKQVLLVACVLVAGCISGPQSDSERGECALFRMQLMADPRVAAILAHQPQQDISIEGDSRIIKIHVNSPHVRIRSSDGQENIVSGNHYTPQEIMEISNVARYLQREMGLQRVIFIHDDSTGEENRLFGAWWKL